VNEVLGRIIDFISDWIAHLRPWHILGDDEVGLIQRLGVYNRDLKHGWNWKAPLLEVVLSTSGALDSSALREQTLTTSDRQQVTVAGVLSYRVVSPRKFLIDLEDADSVLNDVGLGVIARVVPGYTCDEILVDEEPMAVMKKRMKNRAEKCGIKVVSFELTDRAKTRTYRMFTTTAND